MYVLRHDVVQPTDGTDQKTSIDSQYPETKLLSSLVFEEEAKPEFSMFLPRLNAILLTRQRQPCRLWLQGLHRIPGKTSPPCIHRMNLRLQIQW